MRDRRYIAILEHSLAFWGASLVQTDDEPVKDKQSLDRDHPEHEAVAVSRQVRRQQEREALKNPNRHKAQSSTRFMEHDQ